MPQGKGKKGGRKGANAGTSSTKKMQHEEDDDVASINSEVTCSTLNSDGEEEEVSEVEQFESKIKAGIELAQEKNHNIRLKGLIELKKTLQTRCAVFDELDNLHETICDVVERSLKRGSSAGERKAAAKLAAVIIVVAVNLSVDIAEKVFTLVQPTLLTLAQDPTLNPSVREEVCRSVAVMALLGSIEYKDLQEAINVLHMVFSKALPKGNGELPNLQPAALLMHSAALQGFFLLLTQMNPTDVQSKAASLLSEMMSVLETKELEMRVEVGMGVALVYELVRQQREFKWRGTSQLLDILNDLATDSHKYRAKKERKQQRAVFRSIVSSIEDGEYEPETVTVACKRAKMVLEINDWSTRYKYDCICHALEQGFNHHLCKNAALRDHFDLPDVDMVDGPESREDRLNRRRNTDIIHKQRNLQRNKNRDFRASANSYYEED